jgi:hypothetical protein
VEWNRESDYAANESIMKEAALGELIEMAGAPLACAVAADPRYLGSAAIFCRRYSVRRFRWQTGSQTCDRRDEIGANHLKPHHSEIGEKRKYHHYKESTRLTGG